MIFDPHSLIHVAHAAEEVTEASGGIAGTLGLNVQLFIAQLVNFAIVLLVLWKWVFTPVTKALQSRTERIEKSLADAESVAQERIHFDEWKKEEMAKVRAEAGEVITMAKGEANALKASMLIETKHDQEALVEKTRKQLEQEQAQAIAQIKSEVADLVVNATTVILREKLDSKKDKELINAALEQTK
jgi:F-type H+-transporting ATPase subunit b